LLLLLGWLMLPGQTPEDYRIELRMDEAGRSLPRGVRFRAEQPDSLAVWDALRTLRQDLYAASYLEASVDTVHWAGKAVRAHLHLGRPWRWLRVYPGQPDDPFWSQIKLRFKNYRDKPLQPADVRILREQVLQELENQGYPFARVWLDSIRLRAGELEAGLFWDKGPLILWKDLVVTGPARLSRSFLRPYLGIKPGNPYSRERLLKASSRLRELSFLQIEEQPSVTFTEESATLNLYLKSRRASRFDFLIGVLPNSTQKGRLLITGQFEGEFQNPFGLGERLYARFEQLRPQTQELQLAFNLPYILELPFGLDFSFDLYKRDTNYIDLNALVGIQYLFEGGDFLEAFWNFRSSSLLSVNNALLDQLETLPDTLDYNTQTYGLKYVVNELDYRFNPRRGWALHLEGGAGIKTIRRNNEIENSELGPLYDSIDLRTIQFRALVQAEYFIPLLKRSTLKTGLQGGALFSETPLFANEQFRIGGTRILRGFDEQLIFASQYVVGTLEYRLLIGTNSYLFTFLDYAWTRNFTTQLDVSDTPLGFGGGLSFETKAGVFGLSVAYGRQQDVPIDFGAPKVHFGYLSLF